MQEAYTIARIKNGWLDKRLSDILSSKDISERCYFVLKEQGFINTGISAFMKTFLNEFIYLVFIN